VKIGLEGDALTFTYAQSPIDNNPQSPITNQQ
jgi:hypothetical protein